LKTVESNQSNIVPGGCEPNGGRVGKDTRPVRLDVAAWWSEWFENIGFVVLTGQGRKNQVVPGYGTQDRQNAGV
jgi:hypothetical protein